MREVEKGVVATLEDVSAAPPTPAEVARVVGTEDLHRPGERTSTRPDEQVDVVRHQRPCERLRTGALERLRKMIEVGTSILVIEEDVAAVAGARRTVVERAGRVEAGPAGHGSLPGPSCGAQR